jgi:hypothetical protein
MKVISLFVIYAGILLALVTGWVFNILNILAYEALELTPLFIIQVVGIFLAPIGVVMGYVV